MLPLLRGARRPGLHLDTIKWPLGRSARLHAQRDTVTESPLGARKVLRHLGHKDPRRRSRCQQRYCDTSHHSRQLCRCCIRRLTNPLDTVTDMSHRRCHNYAGVCGNVIRAGGSQRRHSGHHTLKDKKSRCGNACDGRRQDCWKTAHRHRNGSTAGCSGQQSSHRLVPMHLLHLMLRLILCLNLLVDRHCTSTYVSKRLRLPLSTVQDAASAPVHDTQDACHQQPPSPRAGRRRSQPKRRHSPQAAPVSQVAQHAGRPLTSRRRAKSHLSPLSTPQSQEQHVVSRMGAPVSPLQDDGLPFDRGKGSAMPGRKRRATQ